MGEQSRRWDSVFNRELSTPGFFQTLCLVALLSSHLLAPVVCLHSGLRVSAFVWHVCGRGRAGGGAGGAGRGSPAFLSIAQERNTWVWSGLIVQEWWSLRSPIVTVN